MLNWSENPNSQGVPYPLEEDKLISLARARRGAKVGAKVGLGWSGISTALALGITAILNPQEATQSLLHVPNNAVGLVELNAVYLAGIVGLSATVGTVIDGFRPTSRFFRNVLKQQVDSAVALKNGTVAPYKYIHSGQLKDDVIGALAWTRERAVDTGHLAGKVFYPSVPDWYLENKLRVLKEAAPSLVGMSTALYTADGIMYLAEKAVSKLIPHSDSILPSFVDTVATHPVQTIAGITASGLLALSYPMVIHRRTPSDKPSERL